MTDDQTTETSTEDPQEPEVDQTTEPEAPPAAEEDKGGNSEAAKYRRRLRETETARDTLAQRVEKMQRAEVGRLAADRLAAPGDVFDVGQTELSSLLNEDGDVDPEKVAEAVEELLASRPGLARPPEAVWPDMGQGDRGATVTGTSWSSVLKGD